MQDKAGTGPFLFICLPQYQQHVKEQLAHIRRSEWLIHTILTLLMETQYSVNATYCTLKIHTL